MPEVSAVYRNAVLLRSLLFKKLYLELEDWFSLDKQKEMFTYWFTLWKETPTDCQNLYSFNILIDGFNQWAGLSSKLNTLFFELIVAFCFLSECKCLVEGVLDTEN